MSSWGWEEPVDDWRDDPNYNPVDDLHSKSARRLLKWAVDNPETAKAIAGADIHLLGDFEFALVAAAIKKSHQEVP